MLVDRGSETFVEDILIEAEAELGHEATESLTRIEVPVLVLCGDEDFYFPLQYVQEMVEMIPRATFKAYAGQGHTIVTDTEFTQDVLDYVDGALE
jgi:pimeloyl-ACP methyl ester carboxylesterase